ncbi:hypothetical protein PUR_25560 [Paenibacillus sp. URB8-2]|nr:hypothetical protein PUR_25560 [Paenibacillus sp. URB8-2]
MKRLQGKLAIITGVSRSKGIGSAVARALVGEGADIFFTHWSTYDGRQSYGAEYQWPAVFSEELSSYGVRAESMELD